MIALYYNYTLTFTTVRHFCHRWDRIIIDSNAFGGLGVKPLRVLVRKLKAVTIDWVCINML